ncbi:unnamed protein product [Closterium sp. Yama58-4]|nr:unnamed protein product [Closterium sp. Yama58-4]
MTGKMYTETTGGTKRVIEFYNHPAGPKTVFFWAPTFKWSLGLANIADYNRPPEKVSYPQQSAAAVTGLIFMNLHESSTKITYWVVRQSLRPSRRSDSSESNRFPMMSSEVTFPLMIRHLHRPPPLQFTSDLPSHDPPSSSSAPSNVLATSKRIESPELQ